MRRERGRHWVRYGGFGRRVESERRRGKGAFKKTKHYTENTETQRTRRKVKTKDTNLKIRHYRGETESEERSLRCASQPSHKKWDGKRKLACSGRDDRVDGCGQSCVVRSFVPWDKLKPCSDERKLFTARGFVTMQSYRTVVARGASITGRP